MTTRRRRGRGRSYFSMPPISFGGQRMGPHHVLVALFGLFIAIVVYPQYVLPGLESLRCGPDYDQALTLWVQLGSVGDQPACESELPQVLRNLHDLLPLIFIAPSAFLVFRQTGAATIAPVMVMVWITTWLVPSPLVDLAVVLLGLASCCVPHNVRGPVPAFSHAIAMILWPMFALFATDTAEALILPVGLDWAVHIAAFLFLPAVLISVPIIGRPDR